MSYKRSSMRNNHKKVMSAMLATMMCLGSGLTVFAEEPVAVTTSSSVSIFSDLKSGHWAEKHILKLAAQGIVLGNNGMFRPNDSVTKQEAVTLALRFMNIEDELDASAKTPDNLKAGNYFKPYIALAIEENLIVPAEEVANLKANESWGEQKASREWIAKVLVRALGKEADAKISGSSATSFTDNEKITPSARGYVNVAVKLELTTGVSGNRFDPLGTVSRAQVATFLGRGQAYINPEYANVYEGVVTEVTDNKLTLYTNGKLKSFVLDTRSAYFTKDSELKANKSDIKLYTKVLAIDNVGSASYVEITDKTPQVEKIEGAFARVSADNKIWMYVNDAYVSYTYDAGTSFFDQNGKTISPSAITADSIIEIQRETFSAEKKPLIVQVKSGKVNKSGSGTVQAVDVTGKTITVKDTTGAVEQYKVDDNTIVRYQSQIINLGELKAESLVNYVIKDSVVTSIEVTQSVERTLRGTLVEVGGGGTLLTYKNSSGQLVTKLITDKPSVVIDGITDAGLSDLIADVNGEGDVVELTVDAQDQVIHVKVLSRQAEQIVDATVVSYDSKLKALTIIDSAKKLHVFTVDDKTKVDYDSLTPTLTGMEALLNKNRKINITRIGDRALSLQVIYKYEGTFVSANTTAKTVTIQQSGGKSVIVPYTSSSPIIDYFGKSNATISDVKAGDSVIVYLTTNQDQLQNILVKSAVQFEVISINYTNSRILAKANGVTHDFYVSGAALLGEAGNTIKLTDLAAGQIINVNFNGKTAVSVQSVKLVGGKILSVDGTTVTVKASDGTTLSYPIAAGIKVIRGTAVSAGASSLTTADHVQIRKDSDGSTIFQVATAVNKSFWRYEAASSELLVFRASLNDTDFRYAIDSRVYVHEGDKTITVQSLKENDKLVLYFINGTLVEIEK